jgi:hypothetical protein
MAKDEQDGIEQTGNIDRRSVLAGGAATVAATALPAVASAKEKGLGVQNPFGAIYMNPRYLATFNNQKYSASNIGTVHDLVKRKFPNRNDLKWGLYQREVEPDPANWGSAVAFDNWPDFSQEARDDLEKQPAKFADPKNAMNPFDTSQVAANLLEHLDEVIRIALWDYAVPLKIAVNKHPRRHHGLTTEWDPAPQPGTNPHVQPTGLTINIDCPDGGWQGYTLWRNKSSTDHITKFVAKWQVPPTPANQEGQIIFIFNGLESVSGPGATGAILQPVLQWTSDGWYMRSWYVTADFDPVAHPNLPDLNTKVGQDQPGGDNHRYYSKAVRVATGDTITGTIQGGRDATGKFNYSCSLDRNGQPQPDTELPFADIPELVYAVCAVETYKIATRPPKPDYPADPIAMSTIGLQVQGASVTPIHWKKSKKVGRDFTANPTTAGDKVEFKLA